MPVLIKRNREKLSSKERVKKIKPTTQKSVQVLTDNNVKEDAILSIFDPHIVTDQFMELLCKSIIPTCENLQNLEVIQLKELLMQWKIHIPQNDFLKPFLETSIKLQPIRITGAHKFVLSHEHISMFLTIPLEIFLDNDRYNHRYFIKHMLYTLYMVSHTSMLKEDKIILDKCQYHYKTCLPNFTNSSILLDPHIVVKLYKLNQQDKELKFITQILIKLIPSRDKLSSAIGKNEASKAFKLSKFYPDKCNIKNLLHEESLPVTTPYYNSQIANDILTLKNIKFIDLTLISSPPEFGESVLASMNLIYRWANQRELLAIPKMTFVLKYFVAWMVKHQKLAIGQNAIQMFKSILAQIKISDWTKEGLYFATSDNESSVNEKMSTFHKHFDIVFLDSTNNYNVCWNIYKTDYLWVKYEAELTLKQLETAIDPNPSIWLFNTSHSFDLSFDHTFKFSVPLEQYKNHVIANGLIDQNLVVEDGGYIYRAVKTKILKTLEMGLKDYVKLIVARPSPTQEILVNELLKSPENSDISKHDLTFEFGLILDESKLNCSVIRGPPLDLDPQAEKEFVDFWGAELSSTRKFVDGTVARAVIFQPEHGCTSGLEERKTPFKIVTHLLQRHCGLDAFKPLHRYLCYDGKSRIERMALGMQFVTDKPKGENVEIYQPNNSTGKKELTNGQKMSLSYGTGESSFLPHVKARDQLCKILREDLADLPLEIESVSGGLDSIYRQTETFPPLCSEKFVKNRQKEEDERLNLPEGHRHKRPYPNGENKKTPCYVPYTTLILWPERNSKWPQPLTTPGQTGPSGEVLNGEKALEKVKTALLISIRHALKDIVQQCSLCKNGGHFENGKRDWFYYLEVIYRGYCFHLHLASPPSAQNSPNPLGLTFEECQTSHELSQALLALHPRFPCYSLTCRIVKRWLACHMLLSALNYKSANFEDTNDQLFHELWVDIVVAYLFLSPQPYGPLNSPSLGLARFLNLITSYDWKHRPLCVPLLTADNVEDSKTSVKKSGPKIEVSERFKSHDLFKNIDSSRRTDHPYMTVICTTVSGHSLEITQSANKLVRNLSPGPPACRRLLMLSRVSREEMESISGLNPWKCEDNEGKLGETIKWDDLYRNIFITPLDDYDVIITLMKSRNSRAHQNFQKPSKLYVPAASNLGPKGVDTNYSSVPITGFDPTNDYLCQLRSAFGHVAIFLHDSYGGHIIGVLWKPTDTLANQVRKYSYKRPIGDLNNSDLMIDYASIIEDFKILGQDLVQNIECRTERWNRID